MMYEYVALPDGTTVTHSEVLDKNGPMAVKVRFERPTRYGFDTATCYLPSYQWSHEGLDHAGHYTDEEIQNFEFFLKCNAHLLYEYAGCGGVRSA